MARDCSFNKQMNRQSDPALAGTQHDGTTLQQGTGILSFGQISLLVAMQIKDQQRHSKRHGSCNSRRITYGVEEHHLGESWGLLSLVSPNGDTSPR